MKKAFLAIASLLMVFTAFNAEAASKSKGFNKSKVYVGGTVGFTSTSVSNPDGTSTSGSSLKLVADLGYDLDKVNSVGVQVGFLTGIASMGAFDFVNYSELGKAALGTYADQGLDDTSGFIVAPYVRHTLLSNKLFDIFVDGVLGFGSLKTSVETTDVDGNVSENGNKATLFQLVARPGVAFKVSKELKVVTRIGSVGYQSISTSQFAGNASADGPKTSHFGIDAGTGSLLFGFEYHF